MRHERFRIRVNVIYRYSNRRAWRINIAQFAMNSHLFHIAISGIWICHHYYMNINIAIPYAYPECRIC